MAPLNNKEHLFGKVAVFIDAANVLYSQKTLGWRVDYQKLKKYLEKEINLDGIYYYTGKIGKLQKQLKFIKKHKKILNLKITKFKKNAILPNPLISYLFFFNRTPKHTIILPAHIGHIPLYRKSSCPLFIF